jgi:hypothetical protein
MSSNGDISTGGGGGAPAEGSSGGFLPSDGATSGDDSLVVPTSVLRIDDVSPRGRNTEKRGAEGAGNSLDVLSPSSSAAGGSITGSTVGGSSLPSRCINPASDINSRLDTQVEVRVYPCNNTQGNGKKKFTTFNIKPEVSGDSG